MTSIDRLDADIVALLTDDPRAGVTELAGRLGVTRNTVQARLQRMVSAGVLAGYSARVDLDRVGLPVVAFIDLELAQGALQDVVDELSRLPHVLEVHATTGRGDLLVRLAARGHAELQRLLQDVLAVPGVVRTTTHIALSNPVPYRTVPLLRAMTSTTGRGRAGGVP